LLVFFCNPKARHHLTANHSTATKPQANKLLFLCLLVFFCNPKPSYRNPTQNPEKLNHPNTASKLTNFIGKLLANSHGITNKTSPSSSNKLRQHNKLKVTPKSSYCALQQATKPCVGMDTTKQQQDNSPNFINNLNSSQQIALGITFF